MKRSLAFAAFAGLALLAAPITLLAQPTTPPATPPAAPSTSAPAETPAAPATPAPAATPSMASSDSAPQGCRTRKAEGEACACLSDTSRIGQATAHPGGYNVCVRPS